MTIAQLFPGMPPDAPKVVSPPIVRVPSGAKTPTGIATRTPVERLSLSPDLRTLEALRFGLVPHGAIEDLTLRFQQLEQWVASRLPHENGRTPQLSEIYGEFGTGKSHTSAVVRHLARKHGYLSARVEVDGAAVSLSDPGGLLFHLWSTLSGEDLDSATPLLDIYLKAIKRGFPAPHIAPGPIDRIHDNYETIKLLERRGVLDPHSYAVDALLSCSQEFTTQQVRKQIGQESGVSGSEVDLKPLIGKRVDGRPNDFLESLVGHTALATMARYKGLVVTIDEFEVEITRLSPQLLKRALEVLGVLTRYLQGHTSYRAVPIAIFIASAGTEGHLGDTFVDSMIEQTNGKSYQLEQLTPGDRAELARRVHGVYRRAYELEAEFDPKLVVNVEQRLDQDLHDSGLTRAFIKHYVALLDSLHGPTAAG
jgi:hypothetical protein